MNRQPFTPGHRLDCGCKPCRAIAEGIKAAEATGPLAGLVAHIRAGGYTVTPMPPDLMGDFDFDVRADQ